MNLLEHATEIVAFLYVLVLPSYLLGKAFYPELRRPVRLAVGFTVTVTVLPVVSFALAMLLGTHVSTLLVVLVATAFVLLGSFVHLTRLRRHTQALEE